MPCSDHKPTSSLRFFSPLSKLCSHPTLPLSGVVALHKGQPHRSNTDEHTAEQAQGPLTQTPPALKDDQYLKKSIKSPSHSLHHSHYTLIIFSMLPRSPFPPFTLCWRGKFISQRSLEFPAACVLLCYLRGTARHPVRGYYTR
ncbi:hypothetical protein AMECASPLE_024861 [Ameca splendens]|uniref:Uncharacterized protein n=1 Tax=Ameca splendens TaxID=208324 RepID=A0ABV0Z427_9TELE